MGSLLWEDLSFDPDRVRKIQEYYQDAAFAHKLQRTPLQIVASALEMRARSFWHGWPPSCNPRRGKHRQERRLPRDPADFGQYKAPRDERKYERHAAMQAYLMAEGERWRGQRRDLDDIYSMNSGDKAYYEGRCKPSTKGTQTQRLREGGYREVYRVQRLNQLSFYDYTNRPVRLYRCRVCGCKWRRWGDNSWSLGIDERCGQCCDNSDDFLSLLEPL